MWSGPSPWVSVVQLHALPKGFSLLQVSLSTKSCFFPGSSGLIPSTLLVPVYVSQPRHPLFMCDLGQLLYLSASQTAVYVGGDGGN